MNKITKSSTIFLIPMLMLLVSVLSILFSGTKSFWLDEIFSVNTATHWSIMIKTLFHTEGNMWLYYVLLHFWLWFGRSEVSIRLLSTLIAVLTIPSIYVLAKKIFGRKTGIISAILLSSNLFFLAYSQEARSYSLLLFLSTLSSYALLRCLEKPLKFSTWVQYVIIGALTIYSHLFGIFVLLAQILSFRFMSEGKLPWRQFALSVFCIIALMLPIVFSPSIKSHQIDWIQPIGIKNIIAMFVALSGDFPPILVIYFALLVYLGKTIYFQKEEKGRLLPYFFLGTLLCVPLLGVFGFSIIVKPIVTSKYLIFTLTPFLILIARALDLMRNKKIFFIIFFIILFLSAIRFYGWATDNSYIQWTVQNSKDDWRGIAAYMHAQKKSDDAIIFYSHYDGNSFNFYWIQNPIQNLPKKGYITLNDSYIKNGTLSTYDTRTIKNLPKTFARIWIILSTTDFNNPSELDTHQGVFQVVGNNYALTQIKKIGNITLLLYKRRQK